MSTCREVPFGSCFDFALKFAGVDFGDFFFVQSDEIAALRPASMPTGVSSTLTIA